MQVFFLKRFFSGPNNAWWHHFWYFVTIYTMSRYMLYSTSHECFKVFPIIIDSFIVLSLSYRVFDPNSLQYVSTLPRPHHLGVNVSEAVDPRSVELNIWESHLKICYSLFSSVKWTFFSSILWIWSLKSLLINPSKDSFNNLII